MPITVESTGSFANKVRYLQNLKSGRVFSILDKYGPQGVSALVAATPVSTGETALAWYYEIERKEGAYEISWRNHHVIHGANIALLINYGHGTGTGGYVPPKPYITRALAPVFARILLDVRKAVTS